MSRHASPAGSIRADQREALLTLQSAIQSVDWNIPCNSDNRWISDDIAAQDRAAELCSGCPVINQCRNYITRYPREQGVYAGTTFNERNSK